MEAAPFLMLSDLYASVSNRWSPQIGDPTFMGWVTVAAYFVTALACFIAAGVRHRDKRFWYFLFIVLFFLGVNKQFDFQSALTAVGRCVAQMHGWYQDRRQVQFVFIIGLLAVFGVVLLVAFHKMVHKLERVGIALLGFGLLLTFVAVRAVGFHHFDEFIGTSVRGARMNWVLELGGITLIFLNAVAAARGRYRRERINDS
ncbi:MAG: isopropylmalate isomerase [Pseudomonadota bacterium]